MYSAQKKNVKQVDVFVREKHIIDEVCKSNKTVFIRKLNKKKRPTQ